MATISGHELDQITDTEIPVSLNNKGDFVPAERTIQHLQLLWNERKFLFRATIYGLLIATLAAFLIPKRYESTTLLMPPDNQSSSGLAMAAALAGKMGGGLTGIAGDILGLKSSGDMFIGILRSRTVLDDLIIKFDLQKVYGYRDMQSTRRALSEHTVISEDRKSGIITITVTDKVPQRAAALAKEYVTELNLVVNQMSTSSAHRERVFLEGRLTQVKADLESAEKDFSQFASKNGTIDIKEQGRAMVEGAATIQGQLIAAQSELQGMKQVYADSNVRVRSLNARVAELKSQLQQLGGKESIVSDETSSQNQDLYPSIRKLPLLGVPYADLYRHMMVEEAVFESLTQEYELAKVAEAKEIPSVKVLDPANVPEHKSFPPRLIIIVLGTLTIFVCAVVWVIGRSRWDEIDPQNPHKLFVQEVLHTLNSNMPWASPNGSRVQAASHVVWMHLARKRAKIEEN